MQKINDLKNEVSEMLSRVKDLLINKRSWDMQNPEHAKLWQEMVDKAFELHNLVEPKHHKYMIENRGCSPDEKEFYNHIHPIEDLLAYIEDPHANDDPEDITIGSEFELKIFTRRWGHEDFYQIKRIETGWYVGHISISGECDKSGHPFLYENLRNDGVNYPKDLPGYFEWLWEQAAERGMTAEEVQASINELAKWVSLCEKESPKGIWEGYK